MKTKNVKKVLAVATAAGLAFVATNAVAQDSNAAAPTAAATVAPVQLSYGVPQIAQLVQAKIGDDTIIAYIKNSGTSYGLDAGQIIYLKQQGVSDAVITAMLKQPKAAVAAAVSPTPAPQPVAYIAPSTAEVSTATVAPTVTYVQTVPATTYYYYDQPYYYPAYGYGYYGGWYPGVSVSLGWGGHWGGGWHGGGGYGGGYHGGGGFHGHR